MRKSILLISALLSATAFAAADRQLDAGFVQYKQMAAAPATPSAGYTSCYTKTDGKRYCRSSAGTEYKMPYSGEIANADIDASAAIAYSKLNLAGSIVNADVSNSAAIADTKLAQITTASKVANSATTATPNSTPSAIVARDASGNFVADKITHEEELLVKAISTPASPSAGYVAIYAKNDDKVYKLNSAGVEEEIGTGGGGGSSVGTGYQKGDGAGGFVEQTTPIPAADLPAPAASAISASDIDWSTLLKTGGVYTKTLGANTTFTFSNLAVGTIVVRLTNTASNYTVTWPTVKWPGGVAPTMSTGARSDVYTFVYDGTNVFGSYVQESSQSPNTGYAWKGVHGTDCSFARSTASLGDPTADSSCTFTQIENKNFGTVSSYLSGSDKLPGIVFTADEAACYFVRAGFNHTQGGSAVNYSFDLGDGTSAIDTQLLFIPTGTTGTKHAGLSGIYCTTASGSVTLRIRTLSADGASAFTITGNSPVNAVEWSIFKIK